MKPLLVSVCPRCAWRGFPERLWCPKCGFQELGQQPAGRGAVREITRVTRAVGRDLGPGVRLATVALELGGAVITRIGDDTPQAGTVIERDGAPELMAETSRKR